MLMIVDAPGLWFRSFYGVPSSVRAPDGTPGVATSNLSINDPSIS